MPSGGKLNICSMPSPFSFIFYKNKYAGKDTIFFQDLLPGNLIAPLLTGLVPSRLINSHSRHLDITDGRKLESIRDGMALRYDVRLMFHENTSDCFYALWD
jgi:hypothetical protein